MPRLVLKAAKRLRLPARPTRPSERVDETVHRAGPSILASNQCIGRGPADGIGRGCPLVLRRPDTCRRFFVSSEVPCGDRARRPLLGQGIGRRARSSAPIPVPTGRHAAGPSSSALGYGPCLFAMAGAGMPSYRYAHRIPLTRVIAWPAPTWEAARAAPTGSAPLRLPRGRRRQGARPLSGRRSRPRRSQSPRHPPAVGRDGSDHVPRYGGRPGSGSVTVSVSASPDGDEPSYREWLRRQQTSTHCGVSFGMRPDLGRKTESAFRAWTMNVVERFCRSKRKARSARRASALVPSSRSACRGERRSGADRHGQPARARERAAPERPPPPAPSAGRPHRRRELAHVLLGHEAREVQQIGGHPWWAPVLMADCWTIDDPAAFGGRDGRQLSARVPPQGPRPRRFSELCVWGRDCRAGTPLDSGPYPGGCWNRIQGANKFGSWLRPTAAHRRCTGRSRLPLVLSLSCPPVEARPVGGGDQAAAAGPCKSGLPHPRHSRGPSAAVSSKGAGWSGTLPRASTRRTADRGRAVCPAPGRSGCLPT